MKKWTQFLPWFLACVLGTVALTLWAAETQPSAPTRKVQQWEHLALQADPSRGVSYPELAGRIVRLGREGWELVCVLNFTKDGTTTQTVYYFKRPLH